MDDLRVTRCTDGVLMQGPPVARDRRGNALPEGELVEDSAYYRRRITRGELRLIDAASLTAAGAPAAGAPGDAVPAKGKASAKTSTTAGPAPDEG